MGGNISGNKFRTARRVARTMARAALSRDLKQVANVLTLGKFREWAKGIPQDERMSAERVEMLRFV